MFEQITIDGARRNPWSFAASISVQSVLVAATLGVPLMRVARLETRPPDVLFLPRSIGSPESVKQAATRGATSSALTILQAGKIYRPFQAPSRIPNRVATGPDLPGAPEFAFGPGASAGDPAGNAVMGIVEFGQAATLLPVPEPPRQAQPAAASQTVVHVGGGVQAAKLMFAPKPNYPPLARQARIAGTVRLAAQIAPDGHIRDLRVMSGHPMLVSAALDAVRQWVYKPTLLNGQPVEVLTDILVNFVLNQ